MSFNSNFSFQIWKLLMFRNVKIYVISIKNFWFYWICQLIVHNWEEFLQIIVIHQCGAKLIKCLISIWIPIFEFLFQVLLWLNLLYLILYLIFNFYLIYIILNQRLFSDAAASLLFLLVGLKLILKCLIN